MASVSKKMKLMEEVPEVNEKDEQVEEMELTQKKIELKILTQQNAKIVSPQKEKKDQPELEAEIPDPEKENKDQSKMDVAEALGNDSEKKIDKPGTSAVLMDSNNNMPEKKDEKRNLQLLPWKPSPLAALLKLPEEKAPVEEGLDSTGGEHVDSEKE